MTQEPKNRCLTDLNLLRRQHGLKLRQRDIRLLRQQMPHQVFMGGQGIRFVSPELRWADAARFALEPKNPTELRLT